MQAEPPDRVGRRLSLHRVVDPVEVMRRHAGDLGQDGEVQGVVEMIGQPPEDPLQANRVVAARRGSFVHEAMVAT